MALTVAATRLPKLPVIDNFAAQTSAGIVPAKSDVILAGCLWALTDGISVPKGTTLWNGETLKHKLTLRPGACLMARRNDEEGLKVRVPIPNGLFELWGAQVEVLFSELHMLRALQQERLEPLQQIQKRLVAFSRLSARQREGLHDKAQQAKTSLHGKTNQENRTAYAKIPEWPLWKFGERNNPTAARAVIQGVINPLERRAKQIAGIRLNYMLRERAVLEELSSIRRFYDEIVASVSEWPHPATVPKRHDLLDLRHRLSLIASTLERSIRVHPRQPFVQNMALCLKDCQMAAPIVDYLLENILEGHYHIERTYRQLQTSRRRLVLGARAGRLMFENEILVMLVRTWRASRLRPESRIAVPVNLLRFFGRVRKLRGHLAQVDDRDLRKPFRDECLVCYDAVLALEGERPVTLRDWQAHFTHLMRKLKGVTHLLGFPEIDL